LVLAMQRRWSCHPCLVFLPVVPSFPPPCYVAPLGKREKKVLKTWPFGPLKKILPPPPPPPPSPSPTRRAPHPALLAPTLEAVPFARVACGLRITTSRPRRMVSLDSLLPVSTDLWCCSFHSVGAVSPLWSSGRNARYVKQHVTPPCGPPCYPPVTLYPL